MRVHSQKALGKWLYYSQLLRCHGTVKLGWEMEGEETIPSDENLSPSLAASSAYFFDFAGPKSLLHTCDPIEFPSSTSCERNSANQPTNNFLKGVKWSPDGTCFLTNSDDNTLRLFELPSETTRFLSPTTGDVTPSTDFTFSRLGPVLRFPEGESIYDFEWYPLQNSADPASCVIACTSRGHPVHLWDAFTGTLRATYRPYDHLDEIATPYSLAFSSDGMKLYTGFESCIRVFDVTRPGRDFDFRKFSKTRKSKHGQKGIISCIAVSNVLDPAQGDAHLYACGSYSKTIGLYDERDPLRLIKLMRGHVGGVTQIRFTPDGGFLVSAARKDNSVLCWDLRQMNQPLFTFQRNSDTNQRLAFDMDPLGHYIVCGSLDGKLPAYDLMTGGLAGVVEADRLFSKTEAVSGVSFHPHLPVLALASGQRHFDFTSASQATMAEDDAEPDDSPSDLEPVAASINNVAIVAFSWKQEPWIYPQPFISETVIPPDTEAGELHELQPDDGLQPDQMITDFENNDMNKTTEGRTF